MGLYDTFSFPGTVKLSPQLEGIINKIHSPLFMVEMVNRKPFDYSSTFPAEIISCRLNNGQIISLFCKYSGTHTQYSYGHRGGVVYETKIYKEVLNQTPLTSALFYGQ